MLLAHGIHQVVSSYVDHPLLSHPPRARYLIPDLIELLLDIQVHASLRVLVAKPKGPPLPAPVHAQRGPRHAKTSVGATVPAVSNEAVLTGAGLG